MGEAGEAGLEGEAAEGGRGEGLGDEDVNHGRPQLHDMWEVPLRLDLWPLSSFAAPQSAAAAADVGDWLDDEGRG